MLAVFAAIPSLPLSRLGFAKIEVGGIKRVLFTAPLGNTQKGTC
jgi:hypothetical protein